MTLHRTPRRAVPPLRVAIIGAGPRGLGALEALAEACDQSGTDLRVCIYDPYPAPGAGPNFDPGQSGLDRLNIPLRAIDLPASALADQTIPDLAEWLALRRTATDPDAFLPRAILGRYLAGRWKAVALAMQARWGPAAVRLYATRVLSLTQDGGAWVVQAGVGEPATFDAVLLTPGQPETDPDPQLRGWQASEAAGRLFPAYPTAVLSRADLAGQTVAVRGLGLSTLDVVRGLTLGKGGRIEGGVYHRSGSEPAQIVPFSLDGQPPMPKPETATLDGMYDPDAGSPGAAQFDDAVTAACRTGPAAAKALLVATLAPLVGAAMQRAGARKTDPAPWLTREAAGTSAPEHDDPVQALDLGLAMATGARAPSAGYAAGQVWRWLQPALRRGFRKGAPQGETAAALIAFDEGMKRYSYGPPVASAQELRVLIAEGLVDLRAAEDPDIVAHAEGWTLFKGPDTVRAAAMIDAVLQGPDLARITDPLIASLRAQGILRPRSDGLGADLEPGGFAAPGLAVLGRLGLGSVIAADSIHDCFGEGPRIWADGVLRLTATRGGV